jgi:lysyl endopeptidase
MLTLLLFAILQVPAQRGLSSAQPQAFPPPPLRESSVAATVVASLEATTEAEIDALRRANANPTGPLQVGLVRELVNSMATPIPGARWRGAVHVDGAGSLRLRLDGVTLSPEAVLWVYSATSEPVGFTTALAHEGTLWTPSVAGSDITLEVDDPRAGSFRIGAVADVRRNEEVLPQETECFLATECQTSTLQELGSGVASYYWVRGSLTYVCSGGLVSDRDATRTPWFLTANHCLSTQADASSMEIYWDYRPANCGGMRPSLQSLPRSNGAELLVTSRATDVTFLRLHSVPGPRSFYGWTTETPAHGTPLLRFSHPVGGPQVFTTMTADMESESCPARPRSRYLYVNITSGGTFGGSSGSPSLTADGRIVGQLYGGCGPDADPCNYENRDVDGRFAESFPLLQPFLAPGPPPCSVCTADDTTACLINDRFRVTVTGARSLLDGPRNTAIFSFGGFDADLVVRLMHGNGMWAVSTKAFSGAAFTIDVLDTKTCRTWSWTNPTGQTAVHVDREAFPFP